MTITIKIVMVFGTFDGLHDGHLNFLKQSRAHGDHLVVVLARDINVKKIKGRIPINNENKRLFDMKLSGIVDRAILGYKNNPYKIIEIIKPAIICLGYDQKSFSYNLVNELKRRGLRVKILRMKPYMPKKYHSSIIFKKSNIKIKSC